MQEFCRPDTQLTIIAHSHGGQVAAYALADLQVSYAAEGGRIHLVTIDMPVRKKDMYVVYACARVAVAQWTHFYADRWTFYRLFGTGFPFGPRKCPHADTNVYTPYGHSGLLEGVHYRLAPLIHALTTTG